MSQSQSPMEIEFDTVAHWTADAVERLGPQYAIPATCRGSASPAGLDWLSDRCDLRPRMRLADIGGGTGGPAAYARQRTGVLPVVVDPMHGACATAERLFDLETVVGPGERVPLADGSVDACWCLGVLCTIDDKAGLLAELHRILPEGGPLGLLVFVADSEQPAGAPDGNRFPTLESTVELLHGNGFDVRDRVALDELPDPSPEWTELADAVDEEMRRTHGGDSRFAAASEQSDRLRGLTETGRVRGHLVHAVAQGG